jgi:hypothetical protein
VPITERTGASGFAFEPEPGNFRLLQRNIADRGLAHRIKAFDLLCAARGDGWGVDGEASC